MIDNINWPFDSGKQVAGMKLPDYLGWAAGAEDYPKKLYLPPIQRGFVWKPWQIVQLWDSLLRGMPIGSFMVINLSENQRTISINSAGNPRENHGKTEVVSTKAIALLDGQQRTLAILLGWGDSKLGCPKRPKIIPIRCRFGRPNYKPETQKRCLWIDLSEDGQNGSPFELRLTTKTQPFGFQRHSHGRLSLHDRKKARKEYDKRTKYIHKEKRDYELFELCENEKPLPWKADKSATFFIPLTEAWQAFKNSENNKNEIIEYFNQMTAFRLAAAEKGEIPDNPRPTPNDFHRHLGMLLGKEGNNEAPLRRYLKENGLKENVLANAFDSLYDNLLYRGDRDIGLPFLMMPHVKGQINSPPSGPD